ncbi:MAG: GrpB family protein [Paracoccaceae bacterium]|nr:GrpB family protein [Paracoccaceae bacterium]
MPDRESHIQIVKHNPQWAKDFQSERRAILDLPGCPFLEVEHIGSTSVPGLDAKPVVDMMASVGSLKHADAFLPALSQRGYGRLEGGFRHRRAFARPGTGRVEGFNLHVVTEDVWETKDERLFRDWLRAHPGIIWRYAEAKRRAAAIHEGSVADYTEAKSAFIQSVVNQARLSRSLPVRTDWSE